MSRLREKILLLPLSLFCCHNAYCTQSEMDSAKTNVVRKAFIKRDLMNLPDTVSPFDETQFIFQEEWQGTGYKRYQFYKPLQEPIVSPKAFEKVKLKDMLEKQKNVNQEKPDRRKRIEDVKAWPHRLHISLSLSFHKNSVGTGTLVGPSHILTAGHNVYTGGSWVNSITANLGLNEDTCHFGRGAIRRAYVRKEWIESTDEEKRKEFDLALLILETPQGCTLKGYELGWCGFVSYPENYWLENPSLSISLTGYPFQQGNNNIYTQMLSMEQDGILILPSGRIAYDVDTEPGQSGSSIVAQEGGGPYVLGVHTNGPKNPDQHPSGVHLTSTNFEFLTGCMHDNKESNDHVPRLWRQIAKSNQQIVHNLDQHHLPEGFIESMSNPHKSYITLLWEKLYNNNKTTETTWVAGMGGVGKTTLALAYAHEALKLGAYDLIYWLPSETDNQLCHGYRELLNILNATESEKDEKDLDELAKLVGKKIKEEKKEKVLLIYDNVPESARVMNYGAFNLLLMSELPQDSKRLKKNNMYLELSGDKLQYKVLDPSNKVVEGTLNISINGELTSEILNDTETRSRILEKASKKGHIQLKPINAIFPTIEGHILMTSRSRGDIANSIPVNVFGLKDSTSYLLNSISEGDQINPANTEENAGKLAEELGHLPLALSHAAAYIKYTHCSIVDYLEALQYPHNQVLGKTESTKKLIKTRCKDHNRLIVNTLRIAGGKISDQANVLISHFAYLSPDSVPAEFAFWKQLCNEKLYKNKRTEEKRKEALERDLEQLSDFSLIKYEKDRSFISLHRLIQDVLRQKETNLSQLPQTIQNLITNFFNYWQNINQELASKSTNLDSIYRVGSNLLLHLSTLYEHLKRLDNKIYPIVTTSIPEQEKDSLYLDLKIGILSLQRLMRHSLDQVITQSLVVDEVKEENLEKILEEELREIDIKLEPKELKRIMPLLPSSSKEERMKVMKALSRMSSDAPHFMAVTENAKKLEIPDMDVKGRVKIVEALIEIEEPTRIEEITNITMELRTNTMDEEDLVCIIKALNAVEYDKIGIVTDKARESIKVNMSGSDRANVIKALNKDTPRNQEVIESANKLIDNMSPYDKACIIEAISQIEPSKIKEVTDSAEKLMTDNMDGDGLSKLIKATSKLELNRIRVVTDNAKKLIHLKNGSAEKNMTGMDGKCIIEAISELEPAKTEEIIDNAKELVTGNMAGHEWAKVIRNLNKVEFNKINTFVDRVKKIIKGIVAGSDQAYVIEAISEIEPTEIEIVACPIMTLIEDMNGRDRAKVIKALIGVGKPRIKGLCSGGYLKS